MWTVQRVQQGRERRVSRVRLVDSWEGGQVGGRGGAGAGAGGTLLPGTPLTLPGHARQELEKVIQLTLQK